MKKPILVLFLIISALTLNATTKIDDISQPIAGFILSTDFCTLEITNYFTTGNKISSGPTVNGVTYRGINLDTSDSNTSNDKNLIIPSPNVLVMGKQIGTFNLKASHHGYTLIITHDKLSKQNGTSYDYQLGINFTLNNTEVKQACSSTGNVTINFSNPDYDFGSGVLIVHDAGIFFRLIDTVSEAGQYSSTVTFIVEANGNT